MKIVIPDVSTLVINNLLENSDIVTMHCPLNKDSEKMCNKEFFSKMKKGSIAKNCFNKFEKTSCGNTHKCYRIE